MFTMTLIQFPFTTMSVLIPKVLEKHFNHKNIDFSTVMIEKISHEKFIFAKCNQDTFQKKLILLKILIQPLHLSENL